ncbi:MAG: hypothetical protein ACT4R6_05355 [Gemmatimonadaceae bacterium]
MTERAHIDALSALLEERKQYETWIAHIDARRGTVASHVLDRVRGDYAGRLAQVTEQLMVRVPELRGNAEELASRLSSLEREESDRRDERTEYELRAAVGEFTPDVAQSAFARCDEAIARLGAERHAVDAELGRLRILLAAVDNAGVSATPPSTARLPQPGAAELVRQRPPLEELAFLKSVVADRRLTPAQGGSPNVVPSPAVMPQPATQAPSLQRRAPVPDEIAAPSTVSAGALTPSGVPAFLKDMPTEQVKTLRCQECGTMNYPTEWYCERCGGELAAM